MRVEPYSLPLAEPLRSADGPIESRDGFLVAVDAHGERGVGEAAPLPGWTETAADCRAALAAATETAATAGAAAALADLDPAGTPAARHGLALALADAAARAADEPLYRRLGADERVERVPANATVGDANVVQTRAAVERAADAGFGAVKVKVGARTPESDFERLWAAREACPGVELRIDANGAWDREIAETAVRVGGVQRVRYIEQPLQRADLAGHAALRGHGVGIALDEGLAAHGIEAILDAAAADAVILKPMVLGGPERTVAVARRAVDAGLTPIVTTTVDGAVARAAAVHVAAAIPDVQACGLATGGRLARDLLASDPAPITDGAATVPQAPGNAPPPEAVDDA